MLCPDLGKGFESPGTRGSGVRMVVRRLAIAFSPTPAQYPTYSAGKRCCDRQPVGPQGWEPSSKRLENGPAPAPEPFSLQHLALGQPRRGRAAGRPSLVVEPVEAARKVMGFVIQVRRPPAGDCHASKAGPGRCRAGLNPKKGKAATEEMPAAQPTRPAGHGCPSCCQSRKQPRRSRDCRRASLRRTVGISDTIAAIATAVAPGAGSVANRKDLGPQRDDRPSAASVPQASHPGTATGALRPHLRSSHG